MKTWYQKYVIKGFFGWENFKWFCRQLLATFSNEPSFFARKRIESFFLFSSAWGCLTLFTLIRIHGREAKYEEILALTGAMFIYAGYTMQVIRSEKKDLIKKELSNTELTADEAKS